MNEILKKRIKKGSKEYVPAPTKGELIVEKRIREDAVRACAAWGMEDGNGYGVKDTFQLGFVQGGFYALSHQWISVEDALPECSVMVLVKDKYGNYDTAYLSKKGYWIANDGKEIIVSFWLPIPKFELNKPE